MFDNGDHHSSGAVNSGKVVSASANPVHSRSLDIPSSPGERRTFDEPSALALVELARAWAGFNPGDCDHDTLLEASIALETARSLISLGSAHVLDELDQRGVTDARFGLRTDNWVGRQCGVSPGGVRRRLRTGRKLRQSFDVIDRAVASSADSMIADSCVDASVGVDVSFEHVDRLAQATNPRVDAVIAKAQGAIVAMASTRTFASWKRDVEALVEHADHDGAPPILDPVNVASVSVSFGGVTHLDARFDADLGAGLRHAIDVKADEIFTKLTRDAEATGERTPDLTRSTLRALAIAELLRHGLSTEAGSPPRTELSLVLTDDGFTDAEGHRVPERTARLAACDADIWSVVLGSLGEPLDLGHARRLATTAMRRAMAVRDGGCVFPGCDGSPSWTDAHHVKHWIDGGETSIANLASLCRHHHMVSHRPGWTMGITDDQWFFWDTPSGERIWSQRYHKLRT